MASGGLSCAGTISDVPENGLVGSHAYTVFGVLEQDLATKRPRLVKLKNPWGDTEWTGEWGPEWIRGNGKESSLLETGPGEFFIKLEDFFNHFSRLDICYILNSDWEEKNKRSELTPDCPKLEVGLTLEQQADTMICFSQIGRRQLRDEMGRDEKGIWLTHRYISFTVMSDKGEQIAPPSGSWTRTATLKRTLNLMAGRYRIIAKAYLDDYNIETYLRVASMDKNFKIY